MKRSAARTVKEIAKESTGSVRGPNGSPLKLNSRHKMIAALLAAGWKQRRIATLLGLSENRVSIIVGSPLFRALHAELQTEVQRRLLDQEFDLIAEIKREERATLKRLKELRDQDDEPNVALGATREFLSRQAPVLHRLEEDRTVRVVIERAAAQEMQAAIDEDSVEVDFSEVAEVEDEP